MGDVLPDITSAHIHHSRLNPLGRLGFPIRVQRGDCGTPLHLFLRASFTFRALRSGSLKLYICIYVTTRLTFISLSYPVIEFPVTSGMSSSTCISSIVLASASPVSLRYWLPSSSFWSSWEHAAPGCLLGSFLRGRTHLWNHVESDPSRSLCKHIIIHGVTCDTRNYIRCGVLVWNYMLW